VTASGTPVLCFPHAGAGAGIFRSARRRTSPILRVQPVQYPGRENRLAECPFGSLADAAEDCSRQVLHVAAGGPYLMFGHSYGALVAYETTQYLLAQDFPLPQQLIVSGAAGPWHPLPSTGITTASTDDDIVAQVTRITGSTPAGADHPGLRALLLRMLRADLAVQETHRPVARCLLPVPVTSLRGTDDLVVSAAAAWRWSAVTSRGHRHIDLPGGHMYLLEDEQTWWETMENVSADPPRLPDQPWAVLR
jgi:surfactin synthase thioesterase subunit